MAGRALTPATRCRLGEPLPHQQPDRTQAPLLATEVFGVNAEAKTSHAVLIPVSRGYSPLKGRFLRVTHPSGTVLYSEE